MRLTLLAIVLLGAFLGSARAQPASNAPTAKLPERDPDYLRAAIEEVFFLAVGAAWYWIDKEKNAVDWDFDSWTQRFDRSAFRFDNNRFQVNGIFHPFSGSAYYGFARANELHAGWAFTYGFMTSFLWEWLLEFKERVSINDQIATSVGGMALGEFWTKLSRWLHHRGTTPARRAAAWSLGLGVRAHEALDGQGPDAAALAAMHARFRLSYGPAMLIYDGSPAAVHSIGFEGQIVEMAGWHREGTFRRAFGDANFATLRSRATVGHGNTGGSFALYADTLVTGVHAQRLVGHVATRPGEAPGRAYGASATLGAAIGFAYRRMGHPRDRRGDDDATGWYADRTSVIHLPGLAFDSMLAHGLGRLRVSLRGHADFAHVDAEDLFGGWKLGFPDERAKTILEREGYYYGWGMTGRAGLELEIGRVHSGVRVGLSQWWSQEGLDRTQESVTLDVELRSRRLELEHWLRLELPRGIHLELRYDELRRRDVVGEREDRERTFRRVGFAVGLTR